MQMITPIVNISKKVIDFDLFIIGFDGVIWDGQKIIPEAVHALLNLKKYGKKIVLVSNTSERLITIIKRLQQASVPLSVFSNIVTAGEVLHYKFKNPTGDYACLGKKYYVLGSKENIDIFDGLDFVQEDNLGRADFIYMKSVKNKEDLIENYVGVLEHARALNIPFVCAGNDNSRHIDTKICFAPGAFAQHYAVLGGTVLTIGKPELLMLEYALEGLDVDKEKTVFVGDNLQTDIKCASLYGIKSILISKGVHVNYLGEGYIPDASKTRELGNNFGAQPDFIISGFRW